MRTLQALLLLFGALAVLASGVFASPGAAAESPPACHAGASSSGHPAPGHDDAVKVMSCCIACVAVPEPAAAVRGEAEAAAPAPQPPALVLPSGRSPAPEPGPPRAAVA